MRHPWQRIWNLAFAALLVGGCARGALAPLSMPVGSHAASVAASRNPRFTLATYNIRNLFDHPATAPDGTVTKPKPVKDKVALGEAFHQTNADVVALVEVESLPTLKHFRDEYLADMGYTHAVLIEGNDYRGIDVAVLSRFPISDVVSHKDLTFPVPGVDEPQKFSRDVLQTTITAPNGYAFTLFVTHLKSKLGGEPANVRRLAEATAARGIVAAFDRAHPGANYAVCGDLNDSPSSAPTAALLRNPDGPRLLDTLASLAPKDYTYWPKQYRERIDYIALSDGMAQEFVPQSAIIRKSLPIFDASDHLPATITIDGRPEPAMMQNPSVSASRTLAPGRPALTRR